jgi:hypothetical protein
MYLLYILLILAIYILGVIASYILLFNISLAYYKKTCDKDTAFRKALLEVDDLALCTLFSWVLILIIFILTLLIFTKKGIEFIFGL